MNKIKSKKTLAVSLLLSAVVAAGCGAIALGSSQRAFAEELDGNKVFYTGIRGAEITSSPAEGSADDTHVYTMFKIGKEETVTYRQNLAYSWIESVRATDDDKTIVGHAEKRFSMEIGFNSADFEKYIIAFQSQQSVLTEDRKSENFIIFTPSETQGKVNMYVAQDVEDDTKYTSCGEYSFNDHITIEFGEYLDGNYPVIVNETATEAKFVNVYEPYATYVSSGDSAVTPLTFKAEFAADAHDDVAASMVLYNLNGQSFELTKTKQDANGNTVYTTEVVDTAAPVICFNNTPSYLIDGDSIGFSYKVIDVLSTSTRATAHYYVLTGEQYNATDYDYDKTDYTSGETNPFIEVTSSSNIRIIRDEKTFIPSQMIDDGVYGLVKMYYEISDRGGSTAKTDTIFVDWCAKPSAVVDIYKDIKGDTSKSSGFLKLLGEDVKEGLTYAQSDYSAEPDVLAAYKADVEKFRAAYQTKIDEAISSITDDDGNKVGKLYAGTDSKFYLPSFDNLKDESGNVIDFNMSALDDYLNTGDYKYTLLYKAKTSGKAASLSANNLAISITEADVHYRFTIYIKDAFGNDMRYPVKGENGQIEWKTIAEDDVWDKENAELLPFFDFYVSYKEATAEAPKSLSLAYVDTSYSGVSFSIKGVSGTYTTKYNLYVFDRNKMNADLGITMDYKTFLANVDKLYNNDLTDLEMFTDKTVNTRQYFTTVKPSSELLESDSNYQKFKDLNWNSSAVSFTPRSVEEYYVVGLTLTDKRSNVSQELFTAVSASVNTTPLKGEDVWAENNRVAIVLFCIAGVCAVGFIVVLIVRPKDKGDIDDVYDDEVDKKGRRKHKKAKRSSEKQ